MSYKTIQQILSSSPPIVEQYIEPKVLIEGSRLFIFGATGVGKSIIGQNIAFSLAKAVPWLGLKVPKPRTTLLIQGEIPQDEFWNRCHVMAEAYGVNLDEDLGAPLYMWHNMDLQFDTRDGYRSICEAIEDTGCDVLIADPLDKVMGGSIDTGEDSKKARDVFDRLISEYGISFVLIHNSRQGVIGDGGRKWNFGLDEARGHTILTQNWPDVSAQLIGKGEGELVLRWEKHRFGEIGPDIKMRLNVEGLLMQAESEPKEQVLSLLGKEPVEAAAFKEKIAVLLGVSVRQAERYIESLIAERKVKAMPDPRARNKRLYVRLDW